MSSGEDDKAGLDGLTDIDSIMSGAAGESEEDRSARTIAEALEEVLREAIELEAVEIHLDPHADGTMVRFRGPGRVFHQAKLLALPLRAIMPHLKIRADLDISEMRMPQDGVLKMKAGDFTVTAPLATLPTTRGERAIIIPHAERAEMPTLRERGLPDNLVNSVRAALRARKGIVVAGGMPRDRQGFLRTLLRDADAAGQLVVFLSDDQPRIPDERVVVVTTSRYPLGVAGMLRAVARNRADLVILDCMPGAQEIGHAMTHAREAAVLFWVPALTPAEAIAYLLANGVEAAELAGQLSLVITERRFPRLCPDCRRRAESGWRADGCASCIAGRKGEVFVHRVLPASDRLSKILRQGANSLPALQDEEARCSGSFEQNVRALAKAGEISADDAEA